MFARQTTELPFPTITEVVLQPHYEVGMSFHHIKLPLSCMYQSSAVSALHFYFYQPLIYIWDKLTIPSLSLVKSVDKPTPNEFPNLLKHRQDGQTP